MKTVIRSILESMLFLTVLAFAITLLNTLPFLRKVLDLPLALYFPVIAAGASLVVAYAFPKPSFWVAFLKLFLGGLITLAIFSVVSSIIGAASFSFLGDWIWEGGVKMWGATGAHNVAAGILALLFYIIFISIVIGMIFSALFALTNFLVLLVMNAVSGRKGEETPQP